MAQFPLIYGIGRKAYGERAALFSLLILALSPLHIKYSTLVNPDMLMVFFVLLTIWYLTKNSLDKEMNIKTAIIAGGLCGLTLASKHPGLAVILPLLYLIFLSNLPKIKTTILALGSTLFVFLLTNPFVLINIKSFIFDMGSEFSRVITSYPFEEVSKAAWGLYLLTIIAAVGEGVFISAVFGTVSGFIKNRKKEVFLMLFPVVYFGVMGGFKIFIAYYMLPVLPFVAISAGRFFDHILEYLNIKKGAIIIVIILIPSLYRTGNLLLLECGIDTRITAKEWVLENIPENSRILIDSVKAHSEPFLKLAHDSAFNPFYITTIKAEADHLDYINKLEEENYDYSIIIDGKPKSMQERVLIDDYIKDKYPLIKQISPSIPKPFIPYIYHVAYDNPLILIHKLKLPQEE